METESQNGTKPAPKLGLSHLGVAGGVVAAMVMLQPIKDWFYTREEGRSVELRMDKVERAITDLSKEMRDSQRENTDRITAALAAQEQRSSERLLSLENSMNRTLDLLIRQRESINSKQGVK